MTLDPIDNIATITPVEWMAQWLTYADTRSRQLTNSPLNADRGRGYAFAQPWQTRYVIRRPRKGAGKREELPVASDQDEWWPSRKDAAKALGVTTPRISQVILRGGRCAGRKLSNSEKTA